MIVSVQHHAWASIEPSNPQQVVPPVRLGVGAGGAEGKTCAFALEPGVADTGRFLQLIHQIWNGLMFAFGDAIGGPGFLANPPGHPSEALPGLLHVVVVVVAAIIENRLRGEGWIQGRQVEEGSGPTSPPRPGPGPDQPDDPAAPWPGRATGAPPTGAGLPPSKASTIVTILLITIHTP